GASVTGALAYVAGAKELEAQLRDAAGREGADAAVVVVADGSGGTHAGLAAGLGDHGRVLGVDVGTRPDLTEQVPAKAAEVAAALNRRRAASAAPGPSARPSTPISSAKGRASATAHGLVLLSRWRRRAERGAGPESGGSSASGAKWGRAGAASGAAAAATGAG